MYVLFLSQRIGGAKPQALYLTYTISSALIVRRLKQDTRCIAT